MSRKTKKNQTNPLPQQPSPQQAPQAGRVSRRGIFIAAAVSLLLAFVVGALFYNSEKARSAQQAAATNRAALARDHAPTLGQAGAKVHIVEFLDPACETCAIFYPQVKKLMAANPDKIRLSLRHVPFHDGSDQVVRILEAARNQDKYWQTLEALFASQNRWVVNHVVKGGQVWPSIGHVGLDLDRLRTDMSAAEISRRMARDTDDARALGVTKTPEYFVNGRPLPRFGLQELQDLVAEELRSAYP